MGFHNWNRCFWSWM